MKLSILIPAYQEARTIAEVLRRASRPNAAMADVEREIIVCDDGSTDDTVSEVIKMQRENAAIRLVAHARNRGKGRAVRTALDVATGDYVLIQDADLEYDVGDYPILLAPAHAGAEVVYGSRFLGGRRPSGMRAANYIANRILTAAANWLFGCRITDEATCFKLFRTDLLRSLRLECERFEFCPEVTAKLGRLGVPIVEVPIHYEARNKSDGKKVRWTDGVEAMGVLLAHRLRPSAGLAPAAGRAHQRGRISMDPRSTSLLEGGAATRRALLGPRTGPAGVV